MYWTKNNTLPEDIYKESKAIAKRLRYSPVKVENGEFFFLARVPSFINDSLNKAAEELVGKPLEDIASFYRLNSFIHDTKFRIHCDSEIQGRKPTHACVFYLYTHVDSGTALYEHQVYGREDGASLAIFDSDDGLWKAWHKVYAEENKLLVYKSSLFHGRFPWQCWGTSKEDGRLVIVKFLKECL